MPRKKNALAACHQQHDPARLKQFLAAMTGGHGANVMIARTFPWKDYGTFVDVGTAQGDLARR